MTYGELLTEIKAETKTQGADVTWDPIIIGMFNDIVFALEIEVDDSSRYVRNYTLTNASQVIGASPLPKNTITLPTDVLKLDLVEFVTTTLTQGDTSQGGYHWPLPPQKAGTIIPSPLPGYPKAYAFYGSFGGAPEGNPRLVLFPAYVLTSADQIQISYWRKFDVVIDSSTVVTPSHWTAIVKARVMERIATYHIKLAEAQAQASDQDAKVDTAALQRAGMMKDNTVPAYVATGNS